MLVHLLLGLQPARRAAFPVFPSLDASRLCWLNYAINTLTIQEDRVTGATSLSRSPTGSGRGVGLGYEN